MSETQLITTTGLSASEIVKMLTDSKWFEPDVDYSFMHDNERNEVYVNRPSFINVEIDDEFRIELNVHTIRLYNASVCVALWRKNMIMHVTLYRRHARDMKAIQKQRLTEEV